LLPESYLRCVRRFRRAPKHCPGCAETKVLAFYDDQQRPSCARCTGHEPIYGCDDCGTEENPFGRRCGTCELHRRLADLLADTTGDVHPKLRPVFDTLMAAPRPQSVLYWLTRSSSRLTCYAQWPAARWTSATPHSTIWRPTGP
jgi:ribosomal protein S27AE